MHANAQQSVRVILSLGSNLGNRLEYLERACEHIQSTLGDIVSLSQIYETQPQNCPEGAPLFLNACVELLTTLSSADLLHECQFIEAALGRERNGTYGEARSCDIDIINYGQCVNNDAACPPELPHPRAHQRSFVLRPLCDIDETFELAGQSASARELLNALQEPEESQPTPFQI